MDWTRLKNDVNGNSRWVCHWLTFKPAANTYEEALTLARKIGGRKYHNKHYGGGVVFQTFGPDDIGPHIAQIVERAQLARETFDSNLNITLAEIGSMTGFSVAEVKKILIPGGVK